MGEQTPGNPPPSPQLPLPLQPLNYSIPAVKGRWDGLAITSLVCGLLFCVPFVTGIAAIVTGGMALRKPFGVERRGKGMAIAGLVLGIVGILVSLGEVGILFERRQRAREVGCMTNLRIIAQAMMLYTAEWRGAYPTDPASLQQYTGKVMAGPNPFICPECGLQATPPAGPTGLQTSYIFVTQAFAGKRVGKIPMTSQTVIAYEPLSNHAGRGMSVLYVDGHVEWLNATVAASIAQQLSAGTTAPREPQNAGQ